MSVSVLPAWRLTGRGDRSQNCPATWGTVTGVVCVYPRHLRRRLERSRSRPSVSGPTVDIPDALIDVFEADRGSDANVCNVAPVMVPTEATVGADSRAPRSGQGTQAVEVDAASAGGGGSAGGGCAHVERLMRAREVARLAEAIERARLRPPSAGREGVMVSAFSGRCLRSWRPCCGGLPGAMHAGRIPRRTHKAESW